MDDLTINVGGPAGSGVMTVGALVDKVLQRSGLYVYSHTDYPSLIKGGHNQYLTRASKENVASGRKGLDILVAIDNNTAEKHIGEITEGGALIYDPDVVTVEIKRTDINLVAIPFKKMALEIGAAIYENTIGLGVIFGMINADMEIIKQVAKEKFAKKGEEVINNNEQAIKKGYEFAQTHQGNFQKKIEKQDYSNRILIGGNTALSIGAIKAGCKFISAYPMTPATSIMQTLAANESEHNIIVKQTEDEIAAINTAIGAAFTGVRAMTASSGGGFSLMVEAFGMAANAEVPLVVVEVQRGGTSTGIPTYTGQKDLRFVQHASQGEFPRIVLMPGDAEECFYEGFNAFNLAEIYQTPVLILSDKELATAQQTFNKFDSSGLEINRGKLMSDADMSNQTDFKRHLITEDGISPRCVPGQPNGIHVGSSYEHDETGWTSEDPQNHIEQCDKRMKKISHIFDAVKGVKVYGAEDAQAQIIFWGSTKGAALEAIKLLGAEGIKAKAIQVVYASPFPIKQFEEAYDNKIPSIIIEGNQTGQMKNLIREQTGILIKNFYGKYDSRPFYPEEIAEEVKKIGN